MDTFEKHDVDRMINFIYHEAQEKVNEIKIRSNEDYNVEKARMISVWTARLEEEYEEKKKALINKRTSEIEKIRKIRKLAMMTEKQTIIKNIFTQVEKALAASQLNETVLSECAPAKFKNGVLFCKAEDKEIARKLFTGEIRVLEDVFLGGVIVASKCGKDICDNTYLTRMDVIRERNMKDIANYLFNE